MKIYKKKLIAIFLIFCSIASIIPSIKADAREPFSVRTNPDTGIMSITATAPKATTGIRYETIGFKFTLSSVPNTASAKGMTGPGLINGARLMFSDGVTKREEEEGNMVITTFTFDSAIVAEKLGLDDQGISGKTVYIHTIFRTYKIENGREVTLNSYIDTWAGIVNDQSWGTNSLSNFINYYNMQYTYPILSAPNTLYYITESGTTLKPEKSLGTIEIGQNVSWSGPAEITTTTGGKEKLYDLVGYSITTKRDTNTIVKSKSVEPGDDLTGIQSGSTKVLMSGMDIYLKYRLKDSNQQAPNPDPTDPIPIPDVDPRPIEVPEAETVSESMNMPFSSGAIRADNRSSERFTVTLGIPTTESLYTQVNTTKYLLGYNLTKRVGIETYPVRVTKDYILNWKGEDETGEIDMTETVTVEQVINIQRAYGYWEIINFDLYKISNATINNYALPGGTTTMTPSGYAAPSASTSHSSSKDVHIIPPSEVNAGVVLPAVTITGRTDKPTIPQEDFTNQADWMIPEVKVKNDSLVVNGTTILDSSLADLEAPRVNDTALSDIRQTGTGMCDDNTLYKPNQIIAATKKNGTYHTNGEVQYVRVSSVSSIYISSLKSNIVSLNSVVIHTPVYCEAIVGANNNQYVQLINPSSAIQLVLDSNSTLNDFTLKINNTGHHSSKAGYYTRDFSRSLRDPNVSYIASKNGLLRNEVRFPFDVYIKESSGDTFIKKNTWIIIDRSTATFYLPMWVQEGIYTVSCRTVAVNADNNTLDQTSEPTKNTNKNNYVATDTFKVEVSGRIYGLTLYDVTDYPMWQEVFRINNSLDLKINDRSKYPDGTNKTTYSKGYSYDYKVGTNDQYGNDTGRNSKYTFPLINSSHPLYKNIGILKTGYAVRFKLDTIGTLYSSNSAVFIKPSFYYVDANGENRQAVDLYYEESIEGKNRKLVKMGSALDQINLKYMEAGLPEVGMPQSEMKNTASILNMNYQKFISRRDAIFSYKDIRISSVFRTFVNTSYTKSVVQSEHYSNITAAGITQAMIMQQMQRWYGAYYLPGIVNAAPAGYDVYGYSAKYGIDFKESFWKKNGYIIVNFDIVTVDSNGEERLSYYKGSDNMWQREGAPLSKTDNKDTTFQFEYGDFIMYYTDKSVQDDYSPGGIY